MTLADAVLVGLLAWIRSVDFNPPDLPELLPAFWDSVVPTKESVRSDARGPRLATPFEVYTVQGKRVLEHSLFAGVVQTTQDLLALSSGYIEFVVAIALSPEVLRAVCSKIDPRLLQNKVSNVRHGLFAFFGAHWNQSLYDEEFTKASALEIFRPLLAKTHQLYVQNTKSGKYGGKKQWDISAEEFLLNLKAIQLQLDVSMSTASSSSRSSIPPFDKWALSPLRPGALPQNRRQVTPSSPGEIINPLLAPVGFTEDDFVFPCLELFWPDANLELGVMEEELMHLENARDVALIRTQEDEFSLLPAFEMSKVSAIEEKPFPNTNVDSLHNNDSFDIEVDDMFLTVDMINAESSPSARRPLTPRNTVEVPGSQGKGKGKDNEYS
ncbi:hypothetical protein C8R46DRAFT_1134190 [Mycena filopes]|nr:hypothetical protein C8R46DRAFT_1134190 [Mycena filopes]